MKRMFLLGCALAASGIVRAQDGAGSLIDRIESKARQAEQAMDARSKGDTSLTSPLVSKTFNAGAFKTKDFATSEFGGTKTAKTKSAQVKTFETRSFLGIKNPWFGNKVFDSGAAKFKRDTAIESSESYSTDDYAVRTFSESGQTDARIESKILPRSTAPRQYLGPEQPDKGKGIDQFTQNLQRDLTMEEVQELLNKGQKPK